MKSIWTYREYWHPGGPCEVITMGEGHTPLIRARKLGAKYGIDHLYLKLETTNPSGSYKDRFASSAVSHLRQGNAKICLATSSGNTGSALAAYCARAGLPCVIVVVDGTPPGKLEQMQIYGAHTLMVKGFGLDEQITSFVFDQLQALSKKLNTGVQISAYTYSPEGMRGVETIGLELAEQFSDEDIHIFSPSGGGGLTLAIGNGLVKWKKHHTNYILPSLHCVQPEGNNTIAGPLRKGENESVAVPKSTTKVSGLQVPGVIDGNATLAVCRKLGGTGFLVSDELVFKMQAELATQEGVYCEPAGAVALAGAVEAFRNNEINNGGKVVCMVTGHGFKDSGFIHRVPIRQFKCFDHFDRAREYVKGIL